MAKKDQPAAVMAPKKPQRPRAEKTNAPVTEQEISESLLSKRAAATLLAPLNERVNERLKALGLGSPKEPYRRKIDGRTLRKTNRVVPLSLRVTAEFDTRLRDIAVRDNLLLAELLERSLVAYEEAQPKKKK